MSTLHERWRDGLEVEALTIEITTDGAGPDRVMRLGRRRRRRHQAVATVACLGLVAGSASAWNTNRAGRGQRSTELRIADETEDQSPATTVVAYDGHQVDPATLPMVSLAPSPLDWSARAVPYGKGVNAFYGLASSTSGADGLVVVSTRPGVKPSEGFAYYTSQDGATWSMAVDSDTSHWFGGIARTPTGLVAVGTAAATAPIESTTDRNGAGVGDVVVSRSTDGGDWTDVVLPVDLRGGRRAAIDAGQPINLMVSAARVVVHGDVTTAAVTITGIPAGDFQQVFAPIGRSTADTMAMTRAGLRFADRTYSWAELGYGPEVADVMGTRTRLYRSTDGETFAPAGDLDDVQVVDMAAVGDDVALVLGGTGAAIGANPFGTSVVLVGSAGTTTMLSALPLDQGGQASAGALGGRLVVVGTRGGWPAVATWTGSAWQTTSLANGVVPDGTTAGLERATVGEGGIAIALGIYDDPTAGLAVSDRGYTLRSLGAQRGFVVIDDATLTELTRLPSLNDASSLSSSTLRAVRGTAPADAVAMPATTVTMRATAGFGYQVGKGDTGLAIARRFDVTLAELAAANPDVDLDKIQVGQSLDIPSPAGGATTTSMGVADASGVVAIEVLDPSNGTVKARLDVLALAAQFNDVYAQPTGPPKHTVKLLHSLDGVTWSSVDLADLAGTGVQMTSSLVSTADGIVATVITDETDPDAPDPGSDAPGPLRRQVALVGVRP